MELCKTCNRNDFSVLCTTSLESTRSSKAWFLQDVKESINCPFCRLMLKVLSRDLEIKTLESGVIIVDCEVLASYQTRQGALESYGSPLEKMICRYWLSLHVNGKSLTRDQAGTIYGHGIQLLGDGEQNEEDRLLKGRLIGQNCIDVELIKMWLRNCEHGHSMACVPVSLSTVDSSNRIPFTLRVVDTQRRYIIEAPPNCRYIALSYTWGAKEVAQLKLTSNSQPRLFTVGGLNDTHADIPTTIKDAMTLCEMLDEQYLWVDALCIQQDDKEDMNAHLANMDIIYGAACVTVVSGTGQDSWAGLPGVRPASRNTPQYIESIRGLRLVNTQMPFVPAIKSSGWNKRAWTFQEKILSKRLLIFTEYQAFFNCNAALWWEDTVLECKNPLDIKWSHMQDSSQQHHYRTNGDSYTQYMRFVEDYSSRALTYKEDGLKAFTGILTSFTTSYNMRLFEGIPESHLEAGILFHIYIHNPSSRREYFPSWSWVGWEAQANYRWNSMGKYPILSELKWYKYFCDTDKTWYYEIDNWGVEKGKKGDDYEELRSLWKPTDLALRERPKISSLNTKSTSVLVFETSVAFLAVDSNGKPSESSFDNELCNIRCPQDKDDIIGQIRIHKDWNPERGDSRLEFIIIARHSPEPEKQTKFSTQPGLWTMLIETDATGISRRVQTPTSTIKDADWAKAKPSWRTVYLA